MVPGFELGHSGYPITSDIYGHLYEQRRREVADRMDSLLWGDAASGTA